MPRRELEGVEVKLRLPSIDEMPDRTYANFMQVNHTAWDFTLHFGHMVIPTEVPEKTRDLEVKLVARITVPATLIRSIITALQTNLEVFEKAFGPIPAVVIEAKKPKVVGEK